MELETYQDEMKKILQLAKSNLPQLKLLLAEVQSHWGYEDPIYRFYHHSFKVYEIQSKTQEIVSALKSLAPHLKLDRDFEQIIVSGTGKKFNVSHNKDWLNHTRPMIEAFFHAKYMLEMICKYADELDEIPQLLPSGWASILCLYGLR